MDPKYGTQSLFDIHNKNVKENQESRILKRKTQLSHKINLLDYKQDCSTGRPKTPWRPLHILFAPF